MTPTQKNVEEKDGKKEMILVEVEGNHWRL